MKSVVNAGHDDAKSEEIDLATLSVEIWTLLHHGLHFQHFFNVVGLLYFGALRTPPVFRKFGYYCVLVHYTALHSYLNTRYFLL